MGDRIIITDGKTLEIKIMIQIGVGHMKDRIETEEAIECITDSTSRSGSRVTTKRDRIRCFKCGEYDYFARVCLTTQAYTEAKQIQKMFIFNEDKKILQTPLIDIGQDGHTISPVETRDNSNL